ncbi:MAG: polysaccharide biosynthesis/export family protein [Bryobacteraceae bacterium]|jgi:polysaccharide export outer membrane protein
MKAIPRLGSVIAALGLLTIAAQGQEPVAPAAPAAVVPVPAVTAPPPPADSAAELRSTYVLGPNDLISVHIMDAEDISDKPMRIDGNGNIRIPMVGRLHAAGLTAEDLEGKLTERLKEWIKEPDVTVSVMEVHSQPVTVLGSVRGPGVLQVQGRTPLAEVLALVGGPAEGAGSSVKITRRLEWGQIPLPGARNDLSGQYSVAEASLNLILDAENPTENILIYPYDVIFVQHARMVYVLGTVARAGGFILGDREGLSVLQALTLAGGTVGGASPKKARILRAAPAGGNLQEIPVDLAKVIATHAADVALQPEDILYVPSSVPKKVLLRVADVAALASTALIYRIP